MPFNFTTYKNKFNKENYDALRIVVPKGKRDIVRAYANENGETLNGIVNRLLREEMGMSEEQWRGKDDADSHASP